MHNSMCRVIINGTDLRFETAGRYVTVRFVTLLWLALRLIPLQINSAKCTFVFLCWAASFFLQHACTSFLSHTHSFGICTHTYTVARASVTHARTHDPMLLSKQGFFPLLPLLSPAICDTSLIKCWRTHVSGVTGLLITPSVDAPRRLGTSTLVCN